MSISGFKVNDPIFKDPNLAKKLDLNNDGQVSFKELKKIAKNDGDKSDLSVKDLKSIGITDTGIQAKVIDAYKEHSSKTNLFSFPSFSPKTTTQNQNSIESKPNNNTQGSDVSVSAPDGPGDSNDWKEDFDQVVEGSDAYVNNRSKEVRSFNKSELTNDSAKELFKDLGKNKEAGHYISKLFEEHPDKAEEICKSLSTYLKNNESNGLFNDPKVKENFVKDVLHDVAYPTDIHQEQKGTCASTASQVKLALEDPKKYVEIATTLADGKNWNNISPNSKFELDGSKDKRSLSAKVMQNAFMDFGNGSKEWGSRESDKTVKDAKGVVIANGGLYQDELTRLQKELFGESEVLNNSAKNQDKLFRKIDENLSNGNSVPFSVSGTSIDPETQKEVKTGHEMLILSKEPDGSYKVFTWGKEVIVSAEDLREQLKTAQLADADN